MANDKSEEQAKSDEDEAPSSARRTHPAYALVSCNRRTGGHKTLFGSPLPGHHSTICLEVRRASVEHSLNRDWFSWHGGPIIEVEMSAAQFAELITTMNSGVGIPATLLSVNGEDMPPLPKTETIEAEKVRKGFLSKIGRFSRRIESKVGQAVKKLQGSAPINVKERRELASLLEEIITEVTSNMPFAVDSFQESAQKVVASAKAEIDAFQQNALIKMGLKALSKGELPDENLPAAPQLPETTGSKD